MQNLLELNLKSRYHANVLSLEAASLGSGTLRTFELANLSFLVYLPPSCCCSYIDLIPHVLVSLSCL